MPAGRMLDAIVPAGAGIFAAVLTFEVGPNLSVALVAIANALAAALVGHALRARANAALDGLKEERSHPEASVIVAAPSRPRRRRSASRKKRV